jgi:predicted PurR-regulated permease PerM
MDERPPRHSLSPTLSPGASQASGDRGSRQSLSGLERASLIGLPQRIGMVLARVRNPLWSAAALVIVVYGMKAASAVLVPMAVAVLLAIIVSPTVSWLEARRVPKVAAVLLVVVGMMAGLAAIGAMVGGSLAGFGDSLPHYAVRMNGMLTRTTAWLAEKGITVDFNRALHTIEPTAAAEGAANFLKDSLQRVLSALSNTFVVMLTMVLILMEGNTVPAKLRALSQDPEADISYFRQIAQRVQSYLFIKTVLSVVTGVLAGLSATILDVDFALLWGLLAFLLNYIPNIGALLAAIPAMLLALIQHGIGTSLGLGACFTLIHMVIGNVLEPMWMGRKLGLSTTVVFLSLAVWYEIWGPVGMLLSVPLTMVIKIMLEHSKEGAFIAALLDSGEPPEPATAPDDARPLAAAPLPQIGDDSGRNSLNEPPAEVTDPP